MRRGDMVPSGPLSPESVHGMNIGRLAAAAGDLAAVPAVIRSWALEGDLRWIGTVGSGWVGTIGLLRRSHTPNLYSGAMTSEAGGRSLAARLAPSGTPRERGPQAVSADGTRPQKRRSNGATRPGDGGAMASKATHPTAKVPAGTRRNGPAARSKMPTSLVHDDPLAALLDEAQAAVSEGANTLRDVRERYRTAYLEQVERWERLRALTTGSTGPSQSDNQQQMMGREVTQERSTLGRIDLAVKSLENAWLFLAREDTSLVT